MKHFYHTLILLIISVCICQGQPANPSPCSTGGGTTFNINSTSVTFNFNSQSLFTAGTLSNNTVQLTVKSNSSAYTLYVAGSMAYSGSLPDTPLPLGAFTVQASLPGSASSTVTLGSSYVPIAIRSKTSGSGETQIITITVDPTKPAGTNTGAINEFLQAPGTGVHTLTLYFCLCN